MTTQIAKAEREYDLNTAAVLKYGTMPELQKQLQQEEELYAKNGAQPDKTASRMIRDTVGALMLTLTDTTYLTLFLIYFSN